MQAERLDRAVERGAVGQQHDLGAGEQPALLEQLHAASVGQPDVDERDVGLLQRDLAVGLAQRAGGRAGEAARGGHPGQPLGSGVVFINDQDVSHRQWGKWVESSEWLVETLSRVASVGKGLLTE